jgi:hypothetical protein
LNRTYLDQLPLSIYFGNTSPTQGNFNVNGAQLFGNPFFKAYGQLLFADPRGAEFEIGLDYEGSNNFTFGAPYTLWDASVGIPIATKRVRLLVSAQNLFNLNTGSGLGRSLSNQGNVEPTVWYNAATGQLSPGNSTASTASGITNINALPPRTIRMSVNVAM